MAINPSEDRLPPMTPQLALRVAIVGSCALAMFAIIFLRLWFLQVLTGNQYVAQANTNIVRKVPVAAPRGSILGSDGSPLVRSARVPAILLQTQQLPVPLQPTPQGVEQQPAKDYVIYDRLATALGMSTRPTRCRFTLTYQNKAGKLVTGTFAPQLAEIPCIIAQHAAQITIGTVTLATNVPVAEQAYISERQPEFPGVLVSQVSVSEYPDKQLAAQVLGTVGPITATMEHEKQFKGIPTYDSVGLTGLEWQYNQYLQGKDGYERVKVNAQGEYVGESTPVAPTAGYNLKTSLDPALERAGTQSLQRSITNAATDDGGAFVAMSPSGQVYGMGSLPSFDPNIFSKPVSQKQVSQLYGKNSGDPALNRATQSVGPTGSTFKVITATAALESGQWGADTPYDDTGQFCPTPNDPSSCIHNSGGEVGGNLTLTSAIRMSDDVFFYHLGALLNVKNPAKQPKGSFLQEWARKFGIGSRPGIDLPYAAAGNLPTPGWVQQRIQEENDCDKGTGAFSYTDGHGSFSRKPKQGYHKSPSHPQNYCGIAELPNAGWTIGNNINMAVGQGDVQASPLQLAMAYAAIANGGTLVTPHIGEDIQTPTGQVVAPVSPGPTRNLHISPTTISAIQAGLHEAAQSSGGTSDDVMGNFKLPVYGKTGTAQYIPTSGVNAGQETDYAWYACFVPRSATRKPIVVVVWVEKGGFGDQTAAPVARQILNQWFYKTPGPYVAGSSTKSQGL